MKKLLVLLFASVCTASWALPIAFEPFNYDLTPTNLVGQTTTDGLIWSQAGPITGGTNVPGIVAGNLNYPGLAPGYGAMVHFGGIDSGGMAARFSLPNVIKTNSVYFSFILQVTDITAINTAANGVFWAGFNNTPGAQANLPTIAFTALVTKTNATGGYLLGVDKRGGDTISVPFDPTPHQVGDVLFVVGSYDYVDGGPNNTGTADTSRLWINPDPSTFAGAEPAALLTSTGATDISVGNGGIQSFCLWNRHADEPHGILVDQLIIGTSWADVTPTNVPLAITSQPRSQRSVVGGGASFSVNTFNANTFQWEHNSANMPGQTQRTLTLNNVQTSDGGSYQVVVGNGSSTPITSSAATLTVYPDIYPRLVPLWSLAPGSRAYLTTDSGNAPNQRSFAYSSLSNQVLLVSRTNTVTSSTNAAIYVVNGDTGADLYQMNADPSVITSGAANNSLTLNCIDLSADGSVFAANVGDSTATFELYYWTDSNPNTPPQMVYFGDPSLGLINGNTLRFGDSLAVRSSGPNTQILVVNSTGVCGAVLTPLAGQPLNVANWYSAPFTNASGGSTGGRTVLLSANDNTVWEKYGGSALELIAFNTNSLGSTVVTNIPNVLGSPNLVAFAANSNILFGIDYNSSSSAPDTLNQYDLTDPGNPLFVRSYNFPVNSQANANGNGRVIVSGDRVYALDANNGMLAFRIAPVLSITPSGANVVLAWPGSTPGYTLQATPSLHSPVTWTNVSTGTLLGQQYFATNSASAGALFYRLQK